MSVDFSQIKQYLTVPAKLVQVHKWDTTVLNKKGKLIQKGKHPVQVAWQKTDFDTREILKLAQVGYNIGYRILDDDLIIDVDPRNYAVGVDSLQKLQDFLSISDLSDVFPTVKTGGGGFHFYTKIPAGTPIRETHEHFPGVEFKISGRQVLCAGSKHPSGGHYRWVDFCPDLKDAPQAPEKLINLLKYEIKQDDNNDQHEKITNEQLASLLDQLPIEKFSDNDSWFQILCASHHATGGDGLDAFLEWSLSDPDFENDDYTINARWNSLGYDKSVNIRINTLYNWVLKFGGSIKKVAQSNKDAIKRKTARESFNHLYTEKGEFDCQTPSKDEFDCELDELSGEKVEKQEEGVAYELAIALTPGSSEDDIVKAIRAALKAGTFERVKATKIIQKTIGLTKPEFNDIVKHVKERLVEDFGRMLAEKTLSDNFHGGKGLVFNKNGQFWAYNGKYWSTVTKQYVGRHVTHVLDKLREEQDISVKENSVVAEAQSILERITATRKDALRLNEKPYPIINCKNGELWINDDGSCELRAHRPESFLTQLLNVEYDINAKCPIFERSLGEIFAHCDDWVEMVRHFVEFMGYTLYPSKRPAHFWILKGPGGDGKSTLMKILGALLGNAVAPESIERYKSGQGGDKHATAELVGKLLVYDDDLNRKMLLPDGLLKKLSEDGELTGNPKYAEGFKFTKVCTVAMLSNGYPRTADVTRGFRRRAMVIPFNRAFHDEAGCILDLDEQIIKNELSGVLNLALAGLMRVRGRKGFDVPHSCEVAKNEWLRESNPVLLYASEKLTLTKKPEDKEKLSDLYPGYLHWCTGYKTRVPGGPGRYWPDFYKRCR